MTNIYVGNLSYEASQEDLMEAFGRYGAVSNVNLIVDRMTGRSRGFAFVEMPNSTEAKKAIEELNLTKVAGRAMTVNEARPKQSRSGGGGGRGRW